MPKRRDSSAHEPGDMLTFEEVGRLLRLDPSTVRNKCLRPNPQMLAIDVGSGGERAAWRVPREQYEAYRTQLIEESRRRFGAA